MYLASEIVNDVLKCSFCHTKFTKVIKLVPECGSSICGSCHFTLRTEVNESNEYICKKCNQTHKLPEEGLAGNKALEKMLMLPSKTTSQKGEALKKRVDEIQAKINELNADNVQQRVDTHCDAIVKQVTDAIDAAFNHLNKLGNQLLEQINEYRASLLDTDPENRPSKRYKSSELSVQEELEKLTKEFQDFSSASSFALLFTNDGFLEQFESKISEYQSRTARVEKELKEAPFSHYQMIYEANHQFCKLTDHLGRMLTNHVERTHNGHHKEKSSDSLDRGHSKTSSSPGMSAMSLHTMKNHTGHVRHVEFLPDGSLASCSDDKTIKVWDANNGKVLYELTGSYDKILTFAPISTSLLASCSGSTVYIWDLNEKRVKQKLRGHQDSIFSLRVLDSGELVSASYDDSIKVWNPMATTDILIKSMFGHGVSNYHDMVIMSDGNIATCSNSSKRICEGEFLKIWDKSRSECVKRFRTTLQGSCSMAALADKKVAVGFECGRIMVFNTRCVQGSILMKRCHDGGVYSLLEAPNELLISGGSSADPTIRLWNVKIKPGSLIKTIQTQHRGIIRSLSLSKDKRVLATGSYDGNISVFSVNFF